MIKLRTKIALFEFFWAGIFAKLMQKQKLESNWTFFGFLGMEFEISALECA